MRVYLADLCYLNDWDTNNPVPLNVGYVAAYLLAHRPDDEVRLFKDPRELLAALATGAPDVLALSHYDWNTNLNVPVLERARAANPGLVTVMGGPNFHAADEDWVARFFALRPELDAYLTGEGESGFLRLLSLLEAHGRVEAIPFDERPAALHAVDRATGAPIHNPRHAIARLDLSTVPSPYLSGLLDPFLDDPRLAPIIETNRGCPYSCTYCCWGQATQSKINRFPLETVLQEIDYCAARTKNPTGFFYIADGNFGIFERDQQIAAALQASTDTRGIPKRVYVYFAKNTNERVMRIAETLHGISTMSMSKQTLNPSVLENIKRKNIPGEQYDALRKECEQRGISTFSELIYGLAGESDESFINGVIATIREGQMVTMYPQLLLAGAESGERAYRERFGLKTAFRIIPRYVGSYGDIHSLEYDEIVVEHNDMTREGYFRIRVFQLFVILLQGQSFQEFNRALRRAGLDYGTVAKLMVDGEADWTPDFRAWVDGYREGARAELLDRDQLKMRFTADDIAEVRAHQLALIPYTLCALAASRETMDRLRAYLRTLADRLAEGLPASHLDELHRCLDVAFDKLVCYDPLVRRKRVDHEFDFDGWLAAGADRPLDDFRFAAPVPFDYQVAPDILRALDDSLPSAPSLLAALYRLRLNLFGTAAGDRVFCYQRMTDRALDRDRHDAVDRAHADLASRN